MLTEWSLLRRRLTNQWTSDSFCGEQHLPLDTQRLSGPLSQRWRLSRGSVTWTSFFKSLLGYHHCWEPNLLMARPILSPWKDVIAWWPWGGARVGGAARNPLESWLHCAHLTMTDLSWIERHLCWVLELSFLAGMLLWTSDTPCPCLKYPTQGSHPPHRRRSTALGSSYLTTYPRWPQRTEEQPVWLGGNNLGSWGAILGYGIRLKPMMDCWCSFSHHREPGGEP